MCLNYARRIWIKLLFPTPLCWMLLNIISWSVMIPAQTTSHNPKTIILSLEIFSNQRGNTSDLLINSFCCWLFDHGVIIIPCEECLECVRGRERLRCWSDGSRLISGTGWQSPAPANLDTRAPGLARLQHAMRDWTRGVLISLDQLFILWRWHHRLVKASRQYPDTKAEGSGFMNGS